MNNVRIYLAIDTFLPLVGGAEKQAFLQGSYLRSQGFEATVVTLHYKRDWPAQENLDGVPVQRVAGWVLSWRDRRLPGSMYKFCYLCALLVLAWHLWKRRHAFDVLHVFQLTLFTLPALLVCRLARKPLVIAMRCESPQTAGCGQNLRARMRTDLSTLERLGKPVLRFINRQLRLTRASITILSSAMRTNLDRCGIRDVPVLLIPNGVDSQRFQPHPWTKENAATVVCVAKMRYQKGLDILLLAWRTLKEQMPEARLIIVGDGPLLDPLQRLADDLEIASHVEFTGFCQDVAQQYRRGHIAVLPSRWEGMPNALLEAMACGMACVATRVSGSEDLLCHDEYGLLVEPEDPAALAAALLHLLREPMLACRYGQMARQRVERYFAFQAVMQKYISLYRELVSSC